MYYVWTNEENRIHLIVVSHSSFDLPLIVAVAATKENL